jgi:molecular chaperone DnaJ
VPSLRNKNVRGDHYVDLIVSVPVNLSGEAKEALRHFDELSGDTLRRGGADPDAAANGADSGDGSASGKKKKKGFMDKLKESLDDM